MSNTTNELKEKGYFVAYLDGADNKSAEDFLKNIGLAFNFPDYYGHNLDALEECINDLSWLEENNYALIVDNSLELLSTDSDKRDAALSILEDSTQTWKDEDVDFQVILN